MENKQIKELMTAMERSGIKRLLIKRKEFELELERHEDKAASQNHSDLDLFAENPSRHEIAVQRARHALIAAGKESQNALGSQTAQEESKNDAQFLHVTSPMVGTFYSSPSPGDPVFIKVGDRIEKNTIVCIVEAMKVMNEVKAGVTGTVVEVLVENGQPIEFGTKLFKVHP